MEIPLFPLHTVLGPGVALPLHIFEQRYRDLVEHCLAQDAPFGIVWIREGREVGDGQRTALASVGTLAAIRTATRLPDGRWDLLVVGGDRVRIEEVLEGRAAYLVARVTVLDEHDGDARLAATSARLALERTVEHLRLLKARVAGGGLPDVQLEVEVVEPDASELGRASPGSMPVLPDDPATLSYLLLGVAQIDAARKQELLETSTAAERLAGIADALLVENRLLGLRFERFIPDRALFELRRN